MPTKINPIDRAIVDLLIEDGRMSGADMAQRIGNITERAVRYRLDRLIREKVIQVTAVVNRAAVGLPVTADVFIEVEPGRVMAAGKQIAEFDCVTYVACSTGANDLSIQIVAEDNGSLYRFVTEVIADVPGVRRTTTVLLPIILKDDHGWPIPSGRCAA